MSRRGLTLLAVAFGLLASGCWSKLELERRAIVSALALDLGAEPEGVPLRVSVLITRAVNARSPGATGGVAPQPEETGWVISATGSTPAEAMRNLEERSERTLFFAHNQLFIIGEGLARRGVRPVLEFLDRHPEIRHRVWVLVARGRTAGEVLAATSRLELLPAAAIYRQVTQRRFTGTAGAIDLHEFLVKLAGTTAPVAAVVTPVPRPSPSDPFEKGRPGIQISGTAVFRGDRLAGYLDAPESRGLLLAIGQLQQSVVAVPCPDQPKALLSATVDQARARSRVEWAGGRPRVQLQVAVEGRLLDYACPGDPLRPGAWQRLETALAGVVQQEVRAVIERAQGWRADPFGFGEAVHRAFPADWTGLQPRWPEVFSALRVDLATEVSLRRTGAVTRPTVPPAADE